jgi:hypothetical protein
MSTAKDLRKKYEERGVAIEIVKFDGLADLTDDELDYSFTLAKALGARVVSGELSIPAFERLGKAADRNKMFIGLHGHVAVTPAIWEQAFGYGKYIGANVDIGHFVAGNNTSPLPFIKKYHERVTHIHVKDRKMHDGPNVPFGQGDTPIKVILQAIRDNKWRIPAIIEFEIPLSPGMDRTSELLKCMDYCKHCIWASSVRSVCHCVTALTSIVLADSDSHSRKPLRVARRIRPLPGITHIGVESHLYNQPSFVIIDAACQRIFARAALERPARIH